MGCKGSSLVFIEEDTCGAGWSLEAKSCIFVGYYINGGMNGINMCIYISIDYTL